MRHRTRRTAPLLGTAALALGLAGCGVPPSEVVEVGEPATGMSPATVVYFLARDAAVGQPPEPEGASAEAADGAAPDEPIAADGPGSLQGVPRPAAATGADPVSYAVRKLLAGPTAAEAGTLTTALPRLPDASRLAVETGSASGAVVVRFPAGTDQPSVTGLRQLACTVARAHQEDGARRGEPVPAPSADTGSVSGSVTGAVPERLSPVEIRVTGGRPGADGWQVTVAAERCPS
ncbi:hypothetical protein [Streptomyces sp. NPDC016845]|uniref:hypothetical protein n=1 Tax=Streptomyces sp. NPDC016845 TaxID=3364972 RepID=UPI0037ABD4FA